MEHNSQPAAPPMLAQLADTFVQAVATVDADGAQVAYRSGGSQGPVVLLLHGISSGAASWLPCASLLAAHARVIAWDAPGYGASSPLAEKARRAADYAVRLQGLVRALDLRPAVIVGHSLGALMAAAYLAQAEPDRRPARVLLASPAQGYGAAGKEQKAAEIARQRLDALATLGVTGLADRGPARLLSPNADAGAREWVRWNISRLNPDGYRQAVAMLCADDIDAYLARRPEGVAVEIGCGTLDVVTPPIGAEALAQRFGLPFTPIPGAGHACYIEQAAAVAGWIRAALDQRPTR